MRRYTDLTEGASRHTTHGCVWLVVGGISLGALIAVGGLALIFPAWGSNNRGKIEGRWKLTDPPDPDGSLPDDSPVIGFLPHLLPPNPTRGGSPRKGSQVREQMRTLEEVGVYFYIEFKPKDTLNLGMGSDRPEIHNVFRNLQAFGGRVASWTARYQLQWGDGVEFFYLPQGVQNQGLFGKKERARTQIRIEGDNLLLTNDEGKISKFTRLK